MVRGNRPQGGETPSSEPPPKQRNWEWVQDGPGGSSKALEEFEDLPTIARAGLLSRICRYRQGVSRVGDTNSLDSGLHEIRYRYMNKHYSVIFILQGADFMALTAFSGNRREIQKKDLDRAIERWIRWQKETGENSPQ
jgi:putative component of toxin-antitoxin plasmid stabilization module